MTGLETKYFVLKPRSKFHKDPYAKASRAAMKAFANSIRATNRDLANDLEGWEAKETMNDILLKAHQEA